MKQTVDFYQFRNAFEEIRPNNFSYQGLRCLFDYLEAFEMDTGEELEFDVIAICCDFSEDTWQNIAQAYDVETDPNASDEDNQERVADYLTNEGAYVGESGGSIVYRSF